MENSEGKLWVTPLEGAETFVNGVCVSGRTELMHGDRLAVAGVHLFRVRASHAEADTSDGPDFEHAQRELQQQNHATTLNKAKAQVLSDLIAG